VSQREILKVTDVKKSFGRNRVLRGVTFTVNDGDTVGLVGPSGAGKSVLLKILGGVLDPDSGRFKSHEEEESRVGFLFQEGALFDSMSVLENVAFPLVVSHDRSKAETIERRVAYERAHAMLTEVGLADAWKKMPGQLSGGMRRRVGLARALVAEPELVLLDDPTGGLDPVAASVIMNLIHELQDRHRPTVIIVSHDIRRLLPSVRRVIALFDGELACDLLVKQLKAEAPPHVINFLATRFDFSTLNTN
jgi:phospholipid/cholesterol/gamma-HCH transport system ATP-binding protein